MGIGIWELLIILAIVLVIFGAKRLRNLGSDIGGAIKNFKSAMKEEETKQEGAAAGNGGEAKQIPSPGGRVIDAEVTSKEKKQV
jgi:sec-independent protein translocase protein TatA